MTRRALLVVLAAAAAAPATGVAYDPGFDPGALRQVACGGTPEWCGTWTSDPPRGAVPIVPLGPIAVEQVDAAEASAAAGRPFGNFGFTLACAPSARWFRGAYTGANGVPGRVLACTGGPGLIGQYRDDPQPGLPFRSGSFSISYVRGSPPRFQGEIVEHLRGSGAWTGSCASGACAGPVQGPQPLPSPGPTLEELLQAEGPIGLPCGGAISPRPGVRVAFGRSLPAGAGCRLSTGARDAVEAAKEVSTSAVVLSCLSTLGALGASAPVPAALPGAVFLAKLCFASTLAMFASEVTLYRDPPDPAFRQVALPRPRLEAPGRLVTLCRPPRSGQACTRPLPAARRYLAAAGAVASLQEAIAVAVNRLATARTAGDPAGQALQLVLMKAYAGPLADALAEQSASGRALSRELRRSGIAVRLGAPAVARARRALLELRVPAPVLARLSGVGLSRADVVAGLRADPALSRPPGAADLAAVVGRQAPTAGLRAFHGAITVSELRLLTRGLRLQGAIPARVGDALEADLQGAGVRRYMARVRTALPGRFGELLEVAAGPLAR